MGSHTSARRRPPHRRTSRRRASASGAFALATTAALVLGTQPAQAVGTAVDPGVAGSYSVLGGQSVTNTGPSVLAGDLGVSPGSALTGFPPGIVLGDVHQTDTHAAQAQADLVLAYDDAAGQAPDASVEGDIGGTTLTPGVYKADSTLDITGTLTLDALGDPDAVFVFQVGSGLTTATASTVALTGGATSCNVFWQVGSSATLGTSTTFVGTIMALTTITAATGTTIEGRALARNGSVTLDTTTVTRGACDEPEEPVDPPVDPVDPVDPPVDPEEPPVGPGNPSDGPDAPPVLPSEPPAGPGAPPAEPPTGPDVPPAVPGAPGGPPAVPTSPGTPPALAVTGSTVSGPAMIAIASVLAGAGLVAFRARRARGAGI